jgi:hypothetical protein
MLRGGAGPRSATPWDRQDMGQLSARLKRRKVIEGMDGPLEKVDEMPGRATTKILVAEIATAEEATTIVRRARETIEEDEEVVDATEFAMRVAAETFEAM